MASFDAELWLYDGEAAWFFVTLPPDLSDDIAARSAGVRRGFGAVRVRVTVGGTSWSTSVFPDSKRGGYLLPVKKEVRTRENLQPGDRLTVELDLDQLAEPPHAPERQGPREVQGGCGPGPRQARPEDAPSHRP